IRTVKRPSQLGPRAARAERDAGATSSAGELAIGRATSVALLARCLDRLGSVLRAHAAAGDLRGDIVDDAADRGAEALIIEVLVIVRLGQIGRDQLHEGIVEAGVRA